MHPSNHRGHRQRAKHPWFVARRLIRLVRSMARDSQSRDRQSFLDSCSAPPEATGSERRLRTRLVLWPLVDAPSEIRISGRVWWHPVPTHWKRHHIASRRSSSLSERATPTSRFRAIGADIAPTPPISAGLRGHSCASGGSTPSLRQTARAVQSVAGPRGPLSRGLHWSQLR